MHFDPNSCNISMGNGILERIGNKCVNKYFKFVGLKLDEFLNWDFQIEQIWNKIASSIFANKRQSDRLIIVLSRHIQIHYFQN